PVSLEPEAESERREPADRQPDPEMALRIARANEAFRWALAQLSRMDALVVTMKFVDGLTCAQIGQALHQPDVTPARVRRILKQLRERLESRGIGSQDAEAAFVRGFER